MSGHPKGRIFCRWIADGSELGGESGICVQDSEEKLLEATLRDENTESASQGLRFRLTTGL
jgi:hypothetical protein